MNKYFEQIIGGILAGVYWVFGLVNSAIEGMMTIDFNEVITGFLVGVAGALGGLLVRWIRKKIGQNNGSKSQVR